MHNIMQSNKIEILFSIFNNYIVRTYTRFLRSLSDKNHFKLYLSEETIVSSYYIIFTHFD